MGDPGLEEEIRKHGDEVSQNHPDQRKRNGAPKPASDNRHQNQRDGTANVEVGEPMKPRFVREVVEVEESFDANGQEDSQHGGTGGSRAIHGVAFQIV